MKTELPEIYNPIVTPKTTFIRDFQIANVFGENAIKDTFKRAADNWENNILYLAELTFVTNMFSWYFHGEGANRKLSELYARLYHNCFNIVYRDNNPFTEEELDWFFRMTD